jgi:hypothetical protein
LNLPDELDDEGWLGGDEVEDPDDVWRVGNVVINDEEKACQLSSSDIGAGEGSEGADMVAMRRRARTTRDRKLQKCA